MPATLTKWIILVRVQSRLLGITMSKDLKCMFCGKELKEALPDTAQYYQPMGGGEVVFKFAYGSKFDKCLGITSYRSCVCDECAEVFISEMDEN